MKISEPEGEVGECCFASVPRAGYFFYVIALGRSLPFQSIIPPVVRRVNITGNKFSGCGPQGLYVRSGPGVEPMR